MRLNRLSVSELKFLLEEPEFLIALDEHSVHEIDPETLSKVLYNKLF
jgi:hypothetical protein